MPLAQPDKEVAAASASARPRRRVRITRSMALLRMERRLLQHSFPRVQMSLIVALTGGFGLFASFVMLHAGLGSMALRYPMALALAYAFFLSMIWLWLRTYADDYHGLPEVVEAVDLLPGNMGDALPAFTSGGGGDFGGGGASASFDVASDAIGDGASATLDSAGDAVGAVADADELVIPLVVVALAVGLALASLWVVYIAPALFAEVLVDGALSYALFRHLRREDSSHWLASTCRRTLLPFAITAVFLALVGAAMAAYAPGARSIGEVLKHASVIQPQQ